jgi:hypothetical protein
MSGSLGDDGKSNQGLLCRLQSAVQAAAGDDFDRLNRQCL